MFHSPVGESKEQTAVSRTVIPPEPQPELHPRLSVIPSRPAHAAAPGSGAQPRSEPLRQFQATIGNRAVLRSLSPTSVRMQTKLTVNQPGDRYEREADRVADRVMRMSLPGSDTGSAVSASGASSLQRMCACGGTCDHCRKEQPQADGFIQRKRVTEGVPGIAEAPPLVHEVVRSSGRPLDPSTRAFMEPRFGYDFSRVRVHTGPEAASATSSVNALAYTVGSDLVFGEGQYRPETHEGRGLIAHELVHTLQQGVGGNRVQRDDVKESRSQISFEAFRGKHWHDVGELGIVYQEPRNENGINDLYESPNGPLIQKLDQETKVFILREDNKGKDGWYAVVVQGTSVFGYIQQRDVWRNLPDPQSLVLRVPAGGNPFKLAATYYSGKGFDVWGEDKRYVVNALVYANATAKHNTKATPGLRKTEGVDASWLDATSTAGIFIWLPSAEFLKAIRPQVLAKGGGSGSLSYDFVQVFKDIYHKAAYGLSFVGGVVHGFLKSLYDSIASVAGLVYDIFKSIFSGSVISDLEDLGEKVSNITWADLKDAIGTWAAEWADKLKSSSPWTAGHAHGYLTGYVMAEALMLLIGGAEIEAIKATRVGIWATKLGQAITETKAFEKLAAAAGEVGKLGADAKKVVAAARKFAESVPIAGKAVKAGIAVGKAAVWTVEKVLTVVHLPQKWAKKWLEQVAKSLLRLAGRAQEPERLLLRIEALTDSTKQWLFHCFNPCDRPVEEVEKILAENPTKEELEDAAAAEAHAKPGGRKPGHGNATGDEKNTPAPVADQQPAPDRDRPSDQPDKTPGKDKEQKPADERKGLGKASKLSERDEALQLLRNEIDKVKLKLTKAQATRTRIAKAIRDKNEKIALWTEQAKGASGKAKARIEQKIQDARYALNEEKGGGLNEELRGNRTEEYELEKKIRTLERALTLDRPPITPEFQQAIEAQAAKMGLQLPGGRWKDPNTYKVIEGQPVYGHKFGFEHRRLVLSAARKGMNQTQFNAWVYSHPEWFQLESEASNASHAFEKPGLDGWEDL